MSLVLELEILEGDGAGTRVSLESSLVVGRIASNDLVLPDPSLSQIHCRFDAEGGKVVVTDLGSTNGTLVNGMSVLQCRLRDGDTILIGNTLLQLHRHTNSMIPETHFSEEPVQGEVFGQIGYTLNRKIADGGMGSIYEAVQFGAEGFVKRVAIKTILPDLAKQDDFISAFVEEACLAADLVHPNIVQIYHLGRHAGGYYIAMEYVDGITLLRFIQMHTEMGIPIPVIWSVYITGAIARGLDFAHCQRDDDGELLGLVHRDVSLNNIMIDVDGGVKLADFGVARASSKKAGHDEELVGCPEFMSPEQAACLPVDGRSDQFALGLVFYEMLTGERVFNATGEELDDTLERVQHAEIPDPHLYVETLPEDVCAMVQKMLRKDKAKRYRDAGMVADACDAYLRLCGCLHSAADLAAYVEDLYWRYDSFER